ncbi:GlsB/YeaQ/YmgE family stress response membrane protein [Patescibacteria group bacterium]|nr:GlsB/YeaQ/YmgE family stress response membrane protein [Patescibacteria group bacterium]MBU1500535.1 GlsB/YeaQ/YmgE family stress response membrane protein [Patescibacteria group bacterium]MBU2080424.1 GlsB/YeaQ/YmgE family stress response membrane protein [Patescibacteria group bacterium]MBU2123771.1 GlsB/YeaQ/YmgE family stress response membrane protein [Patescibacteria group bacterium]MBU2194627.1 GlsB/YeaQ/YmgE family stress response membrane protein [Patescibacteria group bacterium]
MAFLIWIIFGALAGWIASMIMKTNGQQGLLLDIIVGIVGAVLGGWIMNFFGEGGVDGFNLYSFLVAILGAVVLLAIVKMVRRA